MSRITNPSMWIGCNMIKLAAVAATLVWASISRAAAPSPTPPLDGYLKGAGIGTTVPTSPGINSEAALLDLYITRTSQRDALPAARTEAFDDASAYFFDDLMPRFSEAAGSETPLTILNKPVLAHLLENTLNDAMYYMALAKTGNPRLRPYAEEAPKDANGNLILDPNGNPITTEIGECFTIKIAPLESYPSGHAMNGYTAGLLLAEVYPGRRAQLLTRGARYGDNRVLCGVHHPIDVERGRALASAMFAKLQNVPAFKDDLACAREEATRAPASYSASCTKAYLAYRDEMAARATAKICATYQNSAVKPGICLTKAAK